MSFSTINILESLTLDDIRRSDFLGNKYKIDEADYIEVSSKARSGHSIGGTIKFYDKHHSELPELRLWVKELNKVRDDFSLFYNLQRDPVLLFMKEYRANLAIRHILKGKFNAKLIGRDIFAKRLFYECLPSLSDRERLIGCQEDEAQRRQIIYSAHKDIAHMGAILEHRLNEKREELKEIDDGYVDQLFEKNDRKTQLLDYITTILRHNYERDENVEFGNCDELKHYVSSNLRINLSNIARSLEGSFSNLNYLHVLSHGDCRTHNLKLVENKGGKIKRKFIDWEQLGLCELGFDHVTYASSEAGISKLPVEETFDLAEFICYVRRLYRTDRKKLKNVEINDLIDESKGKCPKLREIVGFQMLTQSIFENLHIYSSNLRYSKEQRDSFCEGVDGLDHSGMFVYRIKEIGETIEYLSKLDYSQFKFDNYKENILPIAMTLNELDIIHVSDDALLRLSR
jgi:hypothetical protein